ncbi:MAG TPA: arsenic transporter [Clostridiales bacterium]|nr:arsenic transporter [Clostridiales bacterium]
MKIFVLAVFILTYVAIIAFPKFKVLSVGVSAVLTVGTVAIFGGESVLAALSSVDYNVILMLVGIMLTVGVFSESGMPNRLADGLMSKISSSLPAIIILVVLSGLVSAFIDNVATVLMLAPIGLAVAKKAEISPVPVIIGIAVSSNLQGAATLVGDTTSIMLGGFADMSFFDFFFLNGKPSIFFSVEIGALLTVPALYFLFRKDNKKISIAKEDVKVTSILPTVLLLLNVALLVVTSFIPDKPDITNGVICIAIGLFGYVYYVVRFKLDPIKSCVKIVDFETVFFLFFLFLTVFAVEKAGIIKDLSDMFIGLGNENVFLLYTVIVFASVLISAFIDNIPYVATMLPVIQGLAAGLPGVSPYLLYFGLLCGATLGGNLTPVGASANVVGIGILKKEGCNVSLKDFLRIGLPFTLVAVLGGYVFTWLMWGI